MKVEKENLSLISFARWTKPKTVCTKCILIPICVQKLKVKSVFKIKATELDTTFLIRCRKYC